MAMTDEQIERYSRHIILNVSLLRCANAVYAF